MNIKDCLYEGQAMYNNGRKVVQYSPEDNRKHDERRENFEKTIVPIFKDFEKDFAENMLVVNKKINSILSKYLKIPGKQFEADISGDFMDEMKKLVSKGSFLPQRIPIIITNSYYKGPRHHGAHYSYIDLKKMPSSIRYEIDKNSWKYNSLKNAYTKKLTPEEEKVYNDLGVKVNIIPKETFEKMENELANAVSNSMKEFSSKMVKNKSGQWLRMKNKSYDEKNGNPDNRETSSKKLYYEDYKENYFPY